MTALEALGRADYIASIASRADVDKRTVVKCLRGESPLSTIWIAVQHAAEAMGVKDVPPPAPRPPRPPRPCPACAAKDAELAKLLDLAQRETAKLVGQLELAHQDLAVVRARVAELEALPHPKPFDPAPGVLHRHYPKAGEPVLCSSVPAPSGGEPPPIPPTMETSAEDSRLAHPPQPDATTRALERAVGRPCTVRVDMGDGVLVRAAEVAGHCGHSEAEAVIAQGRARVGDGTVTTPAEAAG